MRQLKVLLADDHRLMLEALRAVLADDDEIEIVGAAESGSEVLPLVHQTRPDIVLLDLRMPGADGLMVLERLRAQHPTVKVIVLSAVEDDDVIQTSLARGATAFVSKQIHPRDLASAIRQAVSGNVRHAVGLLPVDHVTPAEAAGLSESQIRVLDALVRGKSNKEIARELWLSQQTIKFHLSNIYRRFGVSSRTEAIRYAYEHRLVATSAPSLAASAPANRSATP
jgi:DNA-binding NarL/FixJ family response regulator